ncbi:MAG: AAA family ATPase, partial [Polyangiaceae bacterium]
MSKSQEPQSPTIYSIVETVAVSSRTVLRRARNDSDGTIVLVESLKGGSVAQQRQGLERERDLLSQLAAPGLLRARELGEIEGQLVLFFDDFAGLPMSPPEGGMEVGWCLELALQTVRALAELHDHGMIHNELRPENLLVNREAGLLKLVNLQQVSSRMAGVAALEGSGSLAYIAPERTGRVNRRSDHRADYYALGVTLFQMLTGKLPFSASDALGWAHAHLSKQAPLVSDLRPEVPQVLAQFVAKLLAKNPDDRYQGSHGLLADLVTLSEAWTQAGAIPAFELGVRDISREFELGRDVVGRDAELAASAAIVEEVRAGATRLLLVSGAAGVGKSALFGELSKRLRDRSRHWLSGAFDKQARNIPFSGLTQALRGLVSDVLSRSEADLGDTKQQLISALGTNARVMVDLLPDLARILGPQPAVAQLNPLETQHRLHHVLLAFVSVFARVDEPVVLAFDDCQWVDASTAEALSTLLTSPDLKHVMVLAAYRDAEISATHPLAKLRQLVQRLAPERAESLELKPLDPPAIAHWVADTFRTSVSEVRELSELLHRKTDGNPFFVGEL